MILQPIKPSSDTPSHIQTAERMRVFASYLRANPEAAKVFREKTGVFDSNGELTAAYR